MASLRLWSRSVLVHTRFGEPKRPRPRLAGAVSGGAARAGTQTAGTPHRLGLRLRPATRGWCHRLSLGRCHSWAITAGTRPLPMDEAARSGLPCTLAAL